MGLSARAIALKIRKNDGTIGVSHTAVNKAAKRGRIPREADGTFDLEKVQPAWNDNADTLQQQRGAPPKHATRTPPPAVIVDEPAVQVVESGDDSAPAAPPAFGTLAWVQLEQAKLRLESEQLDLAERKGKLIDASQIEQHIEDRAGAEKQALLNWPADVVPTMAAELGVDERLLRKVLDSYVHRFLADRSRTAPADRAANG